MSRKIDINLDNPIVQAGSIAKSAVENLKNDFSDTSKKHIDNEMIDSLIEVAMQSSFDSSPLVIKQKIRNIIKQKIKKST
jgi:hypothetical protein